MMVRLTLLRGLGLLEVGGEGWLEGDLRKLSPREMLLPAANMRMSFQRRSGTDAVCSIQALLRLLTEDS